MSKRPNIPTNRPANAIGFVTTHHRRTERLALYDLRTDDLAASMFALDATMQSVGEMLSRNGLTLREDGFVVAG